MNKIFRVIYSQATQSWVAVSELTKAHKKQSSSSAKKSASGSSANLIKSSAIALALLSGHSAYAALNDAGTGSGAVAQGTGSVAAGGDSVAIGASANSTGSRTIAIGKDASTGKDDAIAIGNGAKAENPNSVAIGKSAISKHNNAVAIGIGAKALGPTSLALVLGAKATGDDSYAIGVESESIGKMSIAFGQKSKARQQYDLVFGTEANTRDQGQGHSIAIGYGAMSGTNNAGKNLNGGDAGGVAIGTGAYTGVNKDDGRSVNSSVAIGAGAGAGFRNLDANKMPAYNRTDVDSNEDVLKKAFGVKDVADYQKIAGGTNGYTNVDINEATALGRNARAIGDQSVAIGAQTIAGMGAIALGGNDITQFANKKYYKSTKENFAVTETEDHNQDAEISKDTISDAYKRLVDTKLDTKYKATYAQDGSVVLGAQAHSGTPLGTALGTNALVRKGAFGATAIGAGSQVQANAEAAVAIGMGSFADGKYAVAAGTASLAKEGDVAIGYKAKATGKEGALAIGLGTNARGDSSIMIGGADVESASKQSTTFEKAIGVNEKGGVIAKDVVEKINGKEVTRHYTFAATKTTTGTVAAAFQELTGHAMDVSSLDFSKAENKNGHASTSLGVHSLAKGDLATAIGTSARADVIGSLALGTGAHATLQNAVAIGTGSTTELLGTRQLSVNYDSEGNIVSDDSKDIAYTFKWAGGTNTSEGDVVSFGSSGAERQLKNVAAGRVAEDSTDAINGSQLNSITKKIAAGFNTSGNVVADSSGVFTSKKANTDSADKAYETAIRSQDKVQLQVGNNLKLDRDETEVEIEVQDDFDKTKTVKKKVKKADFAYSLNPVLTNLTSAEFKADGKPTVNISSDGITITPAAPTTGGKQKPNVSLTENGLNNGGNAITHVAGNLNGAKSGTDAPTTSATKPNALTETNAATVGDVLNSGWNIQEKGAAKDFVAAYDTVNFIDGDGTSVSVENTDNKTSTIKYSVNLGDGLEKDATTNKIKAKAGDGVTVGADGIKVNTGKGLKIDAADNNKVAVDTDGTTITVGNDGKVKAVTGSTETVTDTNKGTDEKAGQVRPVKADKGKLATVDAVANAVNNAAWSITSDTDGGSFATSGHTQTTEKISAGGSVTFKAGDNLIIKQAGTNFTYSLNPILRGLTSAEFKGTGTNAPTTKLTNSGVTITPATTGKNPVSLTENGLNNGGNAISNVKSNLPATKNSDTANTAAAPSNATKTQAVPNTTNMKGTDYVNPNNAATVGDVLNAGWNLKGKGTAVDFVKAYDTVDFVDGDGTTASVESKDGQTSTVKYSVNTTTIKADTANAGKVKAEGTGNTFATAETVASAINDAYWKAAASGNGVTTDVADNVKAGDTVTFKAGKNLTVSHTANNFEFATTDTPEFTSVQFGNNGPKITNDGDNLKVTGADGTSPTKITNVANGSDDNDAVNVSQLKASGWKVAGNNKTEVDTINPSEQVNFLDGSGTTVTVTKDTDKAGKETGNVNVKYDVNVGNGLQKDTANNTISVKPADSTITVGTDGVKVNTGDIATESTGKATTALDKAIAEATKELAEATEAGDATAQQAAQTKLEAANKAKADAGKQIATVENVTEAINKAGWNAIAAKTENGEVSGEAAQLVKPGETVTFEADKNIKIAQNGSKFTFSTKDNVEFTTVKVGKDDAATGKKPVSLTTEAATTADNNQTGKAPTTALNISSGTGKDAKPTQITGVGSVLNTTTVTSAPDGTAPTTQPKLVNLGTAHNQTALADNVLNSAATVRDLANMGWKVSSDETTGAKGAYLDVVKNADEVKFVGKNAAKVSGKTENGVRTITVDVEVPDVKTAKLVSSADGSVIAPSTDSKLQDALKVAKDELAALPKNATDEQKKEAEKKVKDAETALNKALDDKGVATAKNVADMINNSGFTLKTSAAADGKKDDKSTGSEVIKPGKTVEMVAGKNLTVKQEADGKVTYSLNPELINLTSAEFKADGKPTVKISSDGITITPAAPTTGGEQKPNVSLTENGLDNGGNAITSVAGNLDGAKTGTTAPTTEADKPTTLNNSNAATVGDVLNSGWNIRGAKQAGGNVENVDFVRTYDTVDFVSGNKATTDVTVTEKEGGKGAVVTITAKNDAGSITTAGGKVVVGTNNQADTDPKAGDKVAKTGDVANAINQSGWKTNATKIDGVAATDTNKTQLINPGDAVNYENGNGTVANVEVTQGKDGNPDTVSVKYDVKADGTTIKVDGGKVTAVTGKTEAVTADADGKKKGQLKAKDGDGGKLATVESVANAVNSAKWYAKADNDQTATVGDTDKTTNDNGEAMGAGDALTLTAGKNLRVKREGGKFTFATVETPEFEGLKLVQGGNTVNIAPTANGLNLSKSDAAGGAAQPVSITGVTSGLATYPQVDNKDTPKTGLVDLSKPTTGTPAVGDNTAATVGDLRGMGWVLSADKKTDNLAEAYNAQVKNAEEVKFVGASGVIVSGKTEGNVRTITVGVDHQLATNNSVKPVEYTKKDGTKVYPKTVTKNDGTTETKFYPNADGTGDEVPADDVIVSVNGAKGTTSPTTLSNVKSNLPETRNTADAADPTGNRASKSQSAPKIGTADGNVNANNAATVGDVLNSGWNLKGNGSEVDFVRAYDTVNFVNGKGTTVSIETDGAESRVKVDVDTADLTASNGKISAPDLKTLEDAVKAAKADADANPADEAKKTALAKAEADLAKEQNKGVTAQNVAKAINESGFTLKTSATAEGKKDAASTGDEVINPGKTVEMVAGKNLTVKQDAGGKVTYATKDDVEFATVKIGKDEDGKKPVSLTTEKAVNAGNNETGKEPATALKISSDGKPAQLVGVASVLNTSEVSTKPNGDKKADGTPAESKTEKLIDLAGANAAPVNKNAAATVGDLQNMGWVVSTKDGNGYTDVVKNADKVDFKGDNGIEVRGSTAADGTRVITVSAKEGKVTNKVEITKNDGSKVDAVIIDGKYYERDENGKPKTKTEIPAADIKSADNGGSGFVTGNTVANAINKSGWNVGLAEKAKADAAFGDSKYALDAGKPEKVNPDDNVHFANGNNTVVKAATVEEVDKDGKTVTNTYIRVDAELPISQISAVDENGNKVVKDADGNWYLSKADGTADKTQPKVDPAKVRQSASMDPENKGDRYTPLAKRSDDAALTADQKDALSKQQDQYAKDAADKIAKELKGQPQAVIEAAQKAAAEVARVEAKDKYLKDNGLDKGIGGTVITNVAWGQKPDDAVNVDQLQNSGWNLDSKAVAGSSGKVISGNVSPSKVKMDETVNIDAGNNIEITRNGKNIGIATSMTPQFSSVSLGTGADAPTLSVDDDGALNVGSKDANKPVRITNIAPGVKEGDVTNVAQLKGVAQDLNNRIDNVDGNARAGIAQAIATAGLVQAYLPGKSMMAIGGGTYRGEAGYAIGYSSISDGGNWIIKGTASGNSRGHFGASASVGYQW